MFYITLSLVIFYEILTFQRQTANFIHSASKLRQSKFLPMHALKTTGIGILLICKRYTIINNLLPYLY